MVAQLSKLNFLRFSRTELESETDLLSSAASDKPEGTVHAIALYLFIYFWFYTYNQSSALRWFYRVCRTTCEFLQHLD